MRRNCNGNSLRNTLGISICQKKYMDGKIKELYELRLGKLTKNGFFNKFLELLRYGP
jgi:hypothetical protein